MTEHPPPEDPRDPHEPADEWEPASANGDVEPEGDDGRHGHRWSAAAMAAEDQRRMQELMFQRRMPRVRNCPTAGVASVAMARALMIHSLIGRSMIADFRKPAVCGGPFIITVPSGAWGDRAVLLVNVCRSCLRIDTPITACTINLQFLSQTVVVRRLSPGRRLERCWCARGERRASPRR